MLKHTPIATQEGAPPKKDTWFTTTHWYSTLNISMKVTHHTSTQIYDITDVRLS